MHVLTLKKTILKAKHRNHELPDLDFLENTDMISDLTALRIAKQRVNRDETPSNKAGKRLLESCKNHNLLIANGRVGYDRVNYKVRWNEVADEKMRQILAESDIEELNLSSFVEATDLVGIYKEKMLSLLATACFSKRCC